MIKKRSNLILFILALYFIFSIFYVNNDVIENEVSNTLPIIVPFFHSKFYVDLYVQILISVFIFIDSVIKNRGKLRLDLFSYFLIYRIIFIIYQIIVQMIIGGVIRTGNYLFYFVEMLLYLGMSTSKRKDFLWEKFYIISKFFVIFISVEIFYQSIFGILPYVSYTNTFYKACMRIPIGSSNSLSAMIVPIVAMILLSDRKTKFDYLCIILGFIGIFLTKSRTGMILILISVILFNARLLKSKNKIYKIFGMILSVSFLSVAGYMLNRFSTELITIILGYSSVINSDSILTNFSSGRVASFSWYMNQFISQPFFGNGPNYVFSRAHMLIIDLLYQNGLIGLLFFGRAITNSLRKCKNIKMLRNQRNLLVVLLLNSLFEITFFTSFIIDIYFFITLVSINNYNCDEYKIERNNL